MLTYNKNNINVFNWVFSYIQRKIKLNILHLGGEDINNIIKFKENDHYVLAVEENDILFKEIKENLKIPSFHSNIESIDSLETETRFDLIWAYDSLENYSYRNLYNILKNIQLLLKKDSLFYACIKKNNKSIPSLIHIMHHFNYINIDNYFEKERELNHFIFKKT